MALALVAFAPGAVNAEVSEHGGDAIGAHTDALQAVLADYGAWFQTADAVASPMDWPEAHAPRGTIAEAEPSPAASCQCPASHESHEHYTPHAIAPTRADFTYRASREQLRNQIHRPAVTGRTALGQTDVGVPLEPPRMGVTDGGHLTSTTTGRTALASRHREA